MTASHAQATNKSFLDTGIHELHSGRRYCQRLVIHLLTLNYHSEMIRDDMMTKQRSEPMLAARRAAPGPVETHHIHTQH